MRSFTVQTLTAFAFLAISVKAQVPAFKGQLLLEPGLSSAKCLTAASNVNAASVTIQPCTGSASQKWTFGGGVVKVFGDKCLAVPEGSAADGTKLQISTCLTDNPNQKWGYTRDNRMTWTNKGKCIDLTGGNLADGTSVQIWSCSGGNANQVWNTGYMVNDLPTTSQDGQYGINNCGTGSSQSSNCQTAWINSASDFCLWAPPTSGTIGDTEAIAIAYCTKSGRGTRTIPNGALTGVHFVKTPEYVQVTGVGDLTKLNIPQGDEGGELDNRGADGRGNPIGGLVYGNSFGPGLQYHEWTSFISDKEFCFRACVGARATSLCNHIYDLMGCYWNIPANYDAKQFEDCDGEPALPMGVYGTSTWYQGVSPTPPPHPAPSSSNCKALPTVSVSPALRRRNSMVKRYPVPAFPGATPAPVV
ncbi:carbohydrate-binding module family 13 protein [Hebeloma cylindrosporum]|uniref:Carbohydrate-binding module family 13 protein n=1 Tax=Hebeloma cylindrosporum TaxID=76867 RepID=A0A0C3C0N0_HEBCY|nr:carbohydrate-binding module family 13 protein [Hebeloma cylindrosporum h7]